MARSIAEWDQRHREREKAEDLQASPTPLVVEIAQRLRPGQALDLACGTGRNALWLAEHGWTTLAIDGSEVAVAALRSKAHQLGIEIDTRIADLTQPDFKLDPARWDLILMCYYLQRDLFEPIKKAVVPGGIVLVIVHRTGLGTDLGTDLREEPSETRLPPGELAKYFEGWTILHSYEGSPRDGAHRRSIAEIVAQRPGSF